MPLSWNEIRRRAIAFSDEWKDASYEKGETQSFYNDFFEVFGQSRRNVSVYEQKVKMLSDSYGFIDLFWPGVLLVEQKSVGRDLSSAFDQATDYFLGLKEEEKPRYILLSDFQHFILHDLEDGDPGKPIRFELKHLVENLEPFGFIAGYQKQTYRDQDPVNIHASELMSRMYEQLRDNNYTGHDLKVLLVRLMFCLFADDTGIFGPRDMFVRFIEDRTNEDGSDLGMQLLSLFDVLNRPEEQRQKNLDEHLVDFPYINGDLFSERIQLPWFNAAMRDTLLTCCYFDWSRVSPALFGSLFQTVMHSKEQREKGAHYTSEKNILKVIDSLFLRDLRAELEKARRSRPQLEAFHDTLAGLTFFDPACGCGNFLILAYREVRELEIDVLKALRSIDQRVLDVASLIKVNVDQFYGIELEEFPVRIAETALWLVDHQMNMKVSQVFGNHYLRLPLSTSAHIHNGNALTMPWENVLPRQQCNYILGNPPFIGSKMMSGEQRQEIKAIFDGVRGNGVLDYVSGWYGKAAEYMTGSSARTAFVSTNSISQGEQVGILWDYLLKNYKLEIHFAHRTFRWTIDEKKTRNMHIAAVYVVIIGFGEPTSGRKSLFEYESVDSESQEVQVSNINPYLVDGPNVTVKSRSKPLCPVPEIGIGNKPIDGGNYLFTPDEKAAFIEKEPESAQYFHPWIGSQEFIKGIERWCLWLGDVPPEKLNRLPHAKARVANVMNYRLKSDSTPTQKLAHTPTRFHVENMPTGEFLVIPEVSSERREYIPIGYMKYPMLASNLVKIMPNATRYHFGILSSRMHMDWMRYVAGRLKSDYRYSKDIVYNNFPWPGATDKQKAAIEAASQEVLDARNAFPDATMADLYDPLTMPPKLRKAHEKLDKKVDNAYRPQPFPDEESRIAELFLRYQELVAPMSERKRRRRK